jgi:hypothetical protein
MMMKHLRSGIKKSVLHQRIFSVLGKQITSGNMVQVLVVLVLRYITIVVKNTVVVSQDVP